MGLETGTYISDLVITNPVGATDPKSQGDNHIRLLKSTAKATFPSADHPIYLERPAETVASAAGATSLAATTSNFINITGTNAITGFGTLASGIWKFIKFAGACSLTHNGTSFILPGAQNINVVAGDTAIFMSEGSGNWRCLYYQRSGGALGGPLVMSGVISPTQLVADTDNWAPTGFETASVIRVDISTNISLRGLAVGQVDGRVIVIHNITTTRLLTIEDEDTNSTAANRFAIGTDLQLWYDDSAIFRYDNTTQRWRCIGVQQRATGQQSIWVPAAAMIARTTNGAASGSEESSTNDVMLSYFAFDATTSEGVCFAFQAPKSSNQASSSWLVAQFVWKHPATTTNFGVRWCIKALALSDDDAIDTAYSAATEVTDTGGTTGDVYQSAETAAFGPSNTPASEDLIVVEVTRLPANAADTMAVDAHLLGVRLHYVTRALTDD